jgi:hypothetical protein
VHWPELLKLGFCIEFITPIVKARKGKEIKSFFTLSEYDTWKATITKSESIIYFILMCCFCRLLPGPKAGRSSTTRDWERPSAMRRANTFPICPNIASASNTAAKWTAKHSNSPFTRLCPLCKQKTRRKILFLKVFFFRRKRRSARCGSQRRTAKTF